MKSHKIPPIKTRESKEWKTKTKNKGNTEKTIINMVDLNPIVSTTDLKTSYCMLPTRTQFRVS